ncbi:MAG: hypothetical protein JWM02_1179, partial [Frankiales bacterium]|nr:hypothetical protein [Frankiales bacterium]
MRGQLLTRQGEPRVSYAGEELDEVDREHPERNLPVRLLPADVEPDPGREAPGSVQGVVGVPPLRTTRGHAPWQELIPEGFLQLPGTVLYVDDDQDQGGGHAERGGWDPHALASERVKLLSERVEVSAGDGVKDAHSDVALTVIERRAPNRHVATVTSPAGAANQRRCTRFSCGPFATGRTPQAGHAMRYRCGADRSRPRPERGGPSSADPSRLSPVAAPARSE